MDAILFFSQHPLSCRITFSPLKGWTNILLKTDLCLQQRCADGWLSNNLSCQSRKTKTCGSILGQMNSPHSAPPCIGNGVFVIFFPLILELIFYISISNCIVYWWPDRCVGGGVFTQVNPAQWTLWAVFVSPDSGNGRFLRGELLQQWSVTSTLKVPSDITTFACSCAAP